MASPYYEVDYKNWKHWLYPLCLFIASWAIILTASVAAIPFLLQQIGVWGGILLVCKSSTMLAEDETSRPRTVMMILYDIALLGLGITAAVMGGPLGLMLGISMIISSLDILYYAHQLYTMISYDPLTDHQTASSGNAPSLSSIGMEAPHPTVSHTERSTLLPGSGANATSGGSYGSAEQPSPTEAAQTAPVAAC